MDGLFGPEAGVDYETEGIIDGWNERLSKMGVEPNPIVNDIFRDPKLFRGLQVKLGNQELYSWYEATTRFNNLVPKERERRDKGNTSGLFGEDVTIQETVHADGRIRRAESGYQLNVDGLIEKGVDPSRVAMFRLTQPAETPKPEYYWTANYFETQKGLQQEVTPEQRAKAVTLVGSLKSISENGGLIVDINDSGCLDARQIGMGSYDQARAVAVLKK